MTDDIKGAPAPRRGKPGPAGSGPRPTARPGTRTGPKPAWMNALKSIYDDALSEDVPDDLARLIEQLDAGKPEKGDA